MKNKPFKRVQSGKRILSVTIKRMIDESPDTSYMGEYSSRATSEFSIDRNHTEDCASQDYNHREVVDKLERILGHIERWQSALLDTCDCADRSWYGSEHDSACPVTDEEADALQAAFAEVTEAQEDVQACDCGINLIGRGEYRYFNPSFNLYVDKDGHALPGNTPEEVRKYVRQDYERMEAYNAQQWCYIGIAAEAEVILNLQHDSPDGTKWHGTVQKIHSGGVWGIESDSERSYIEEEQANQLAELKTELLALGFSKRAISQAFKPENIKERDA